MNKPAGVVSTAREPGGRPAVVELVDSTARLYPVGRLDADSTGLLLLTNDGELANRLTHPRYGVRKAYRAELRRPPSDADLRRLASGVELEDGMTAPAEVRRLGEREIEIVLREGRNRQVRRMAEAIGNQVVTLRRVRFGPIELGSLSQGQARRLGEDEIARLWEDSEAMSEERLFAVRGAVQAEANEAEAIVGATEDADAGAARPQRAQRRGDGQLPLHHHRRPRRRVPRRRRAPARARLGAADLRPRDRRAGRDAAGDPGDGPLLRPASATSRPTCT